MDYTYYLFTLDCDSALQATDKPVNPANIQILHTFIYLFDFFKKNKKTTNLSNTMPINKEYYKLAIVISWMLICICGPGQMLTGILKYSTFKYTINKTCY